MKSQTFGRGGKYHRKGLKIIVMAVALPVFLRLWWSRPQANPDAIFRQQP